jgi:hypothetical protein
MRIRLTSILAATAVLACLAPPAAKSQTDTALKLTTTVPQASAEFRAGVVDWENFSPEAAASHFGAAIKADPNFGLARVMYGFAGTASSEGLVSLFFGGNSDFGGTDYSASLWYVSLPKASVSVDGKPILRDGQFVGTK